MNHFFTLACLVLSLAVNAQTPIISHKSHSGSSMDYFIDPSANFGIPSPKLIQVIRVNDSVCVNVYSEYGGTIFHDTLYTRTSYDLNIDSVQTQSYRKNVEYVNFKHSPKNAKPKLPGNQQMQSEQMYSDELQPEPQQEAPAKKKKKRSALLFIFLATGGGLITFRFFNRLFASQPVS